MNKSLHNVLSEFPHNDVDSIVLNQPKNIKWSGTWYTLFGLPNFALWNMVVLVSAVSDFYFATMCYSLLSDYVLDLVPVYIISDLICFINFFLLLLHRFWRKLNKKLSITIKTPYLLLMLDIISILPQATMFVIVLKPEYKHILLYCRLVTCLRLHNLLFFTRIQRRVQETRCMWFLIQWTFSALIVLHAANSAWYLVSHIKPLCGDELHLKNDGRENHTHNLNHSYGTIQILLNIGFGDFYPTTICEICWFLVTLLTGQFLSIMFICTLTWLMIQHKFHEVIYFQRLAHVNKYLEDVSATIKKFIKNYYQNLWDKHDGICHPSMFNLLPTSMKMDMTFDMNCGLIHRSVLLKNLPKYIQRKISLAMKDIYLPPGEVIYYQHIVKKYMVCIEKGILEVLYDDDDHSPVISFKGGTILGETSLFLNIPSKTTVRAATYTELKVLEKEDFLKIMTDYPDALKYLRKTVENRIDAILNDKTLRPVNSQDLKRLKLQLYESSIKTNTESRLFGDYKNEYLTLYRASTNVTAQQTSYICVKNNFPWILQENSSLLKIWKLLLSITQIMLCLSYPYYVVFKRHIPQSLFVFGIVTDILCLVDIIIQCTTAINLKEQTITKIPEILDCRLDNWKFYSDVFSLFPIETWSYLLENPVERNRFYDLLKLNRLLRLWRISELLSLFENKTEPNSYITWLLKTITYMLLFTYYAACVFYLKACFYKICERDSWFYQITMKNIKETQENHHIEFAMLTSIYFTVMPTFHMGIGNILLISYSDIALVVFIICAAGLLKYYCIGQLASCLFFNDFVEKKLFGYFKITKLARLRIQQHFLMESYRYDKNGKAFIQKTVPMIKNEIQTSKIRNILSDIPLLEMVDTYFLTMVENETTICKLLQNEILYHYGDPTRRMFVMQKGCCHLFNSDNLLEKTLGPGSQFGVTDMLLGLPKQHTVVAVTDCIIIAVEYSSFYEILKMFPKEYEIVEGIIRTQEFKQMVKYMDFDTTDQEHDIKNYRKIQTKSFIAINWNDYWEPYKNRLGIFWFFGMLLMPMTIHPEGLFLKIWCGIRCFLIIIIGTILPVLLMAPPFADALYWLFFVCQISLYLDMYILFHVAYHNERGLFKTHPIYTAWHYTSRSFLMDLITALPMDQIFLYSNPLHADRHSGITHIFASHGHHCTWKLVTLIQFHRVFKFLNYLGVNKRALSKPLKIIKCILILILTINVLTSLLLNINCSYDYGEKPQEHQFYKEVFYHPSNGSVYYGRLKCENSIFNRAISPWGKYMIGFYSITNFITTTCLEDIDANSWLSMTGVILIALLGFAIFADLTATISTILLQEDIIKREYPKNVDHLIKFCTRNNLSNKLKTQVIKHLNFIWERTKGLDYPKILLDFDLNTSLTEDVLLMQYQHVLELSTIFKELDTHFLRLIITHIQLLHFRKGEIIIRYNDIISQIFIIASGEAEILNEEKEYVITISVGGTFGNISRSIYGSSPIYVVARRNVSIYAIPTKKFFKIIEYHPNILRKIKNTLDSKTEFCIPISSSSSSSKDKLSKDPIKGSNFFDELESDEEPVIKIALAPVKIKSLQFCMPLRWFRFSLHPSDSTFKGVDNLTCWASFLNIFFIPYMFTTQDKSYWCYSDLLLEPIFYVRVFIKLHQRYINFYGNLIRSNRKLIRKYFNNPMRVLWDVVPNIPISVICFFYSHDDRFFLYTCLRLLQLLRFYYILEYFNVREQKLKVNPWLLLVKLSVFFCIIIHLLSCLLLLMTCTFGNCNEDIWIFKNSKHIINKPAIYKVILSYYYIISTITTTGIGDVVPQYLLEIIFTTAVMLIGKIMIAVFVGAALRGIYLSNIDFVRFEYNCLLFKKYLQNHHISDYQVKMIWLYLKKLWMHEEGSNFPKLFQSIPYVLSCDVMTSLYGHHLRRSFLFINIEESFLRQICSKLRRVVFFKHDYIVKYGDTDSCMYFIHNGNVSVLTKHQDLTETQHAELHPNDTFGVSQGLNQEALHHFTYRAASNVVEILILPFDSWSYLLPYFPEDERLIFTRVQREYTTL